MLIDRHVPTVAELAKYCRDNLFANYVWMTRTNDTIAAQLVAFMNQASQNNSPFGGLHTTVPASLLS